MINVLWEISPYLILATLLYVEGNGKRYIEKYSQHKKNI